jgi:hypothetical protein
MPPLEDIGAARLATEEKSFSKVYGRELKEPKDVQ